MWNNERTENNLRTDLVHISPTTNLKEKYIIKLKTEITFCELKTDLSLQTKRNWGEKTHTFGYIQVNS